MGVTTGIVRSAVRLDFDDARSKLTSNKVATEHHARTIENIVSQRFSHVHATTMTKKGRL